MPKTDVRKRGTVKSFDAKKGYGFIAGEEKGKDIFVHHTDINADGFRTLNPNDVVEFDLASSKKGLQARNVVVVG